jgi:hypothetical protein
VIVELRKDIGDALLDRAGSVAQAQGRSAWVKEYGALRRKQARAAAMTNEDLQRMKALQAEAERLVPISKKPSP